MSHFVAQELITKDESFFNDLSKEELVDCIMTMIELVKEGAVTKPTISSLNANITGKKRPVSEAQETSADLEGSVSRLRDILCKQIKSQLKWKTSCKEGKAQWKYQGMCGGDEIFRSLMGCAINFKRKKMSLEEFYSILRVHSIYASVRYDTLTLRGDVNVSWDPDTKEFTFSGKYG
eukprot:gene29499-35604_t